MKSFNTFIGDQRLKDLIESFNLPAADKYILITIPKDQLQRPEQHFGIIFYDEGEIKVEIMAGCTTILLVDKSFQCDYKGVECFETLTEILGRLS